jgi:tRNA threonylcarbamoyladenosine biosynthesis protein TsaB
LKILSLDSTAKVASAAVCEDEKMLSSFTCKNALSHSELLLPMAIEAMKEAGTSIDEIGLFTCTVGPGSFTGVRIGTAVIKGLAFGRSIPCVPVSTLESLAENLFPLDGIYCPLMDARRDQVYNALFEARDGLLTRLCEDRAISLSELEKELTEKYSDRKIRFSGDGYEVAMRFFENSALKIEKTPYTLIEQNAVSTAVCAYRKYLSGDFVSDSEFFPTYLRMPSAERERLEKLNQTENKKEGK